MYRKNIITLIIYFLALYSIDCLAQKPEWLYYTNRNPINSLAVYEEYIWAGTNDGLVKINQTSGRTEFFHCANSGLPDNNIRSLTIDSRGQVWMITGNSLASFDGSNWRVYTESNSGLPIDILSTVSDDSLGNIWIGTHAKGLVHFDGRNWTLFIKENSGLHFNNIWNLPTPKKY